MNKPISERHTPTEGNINGGELSKEELCANGAEKSGTCATSVEAAPTAETVTAMKNSSETALKTKPETQPPPSHPAPTTEPLLSASEEIILHISEQKNCPRWLQTVCKDWLTDFYARSAASPVAHPAPKDRQLRSVLAMVAQGSQLALDNPKWRLSEEVCDAIRAVMPYWTSPEVCHAPSSEINNGGELDSALSPERLKFERWYAANRMGLCLHLEQRLRMAIEDTARACWMEGYKSAKPPQFPEPRNEESHE